jgi:hypothetical protein
MYKMYFSARMRKQDYLVSLIGALEPNEKRYFKLFSAMQPGEKRYLKLFDALENKTRYETTELCNELGLQQWQLADDKHYLTQVLLQSLRNYDQESSPATVLRNNRENIQSLLARRMFHFALELVEKSLEQAWQLEAFELIDSILVSRESCRQNIGIVADKDDTLAIHEKVSACMEQILQLMLLRGQSRMLDMNGADNRKFDKIVSHPLIAGNINELKSLRAKSLRYEILCNYYNNRLDDEGVIKTAREERQLYLNNPLIKSINPIVYFTNITRGVSGEPDYKVRQQLLQRLRKEIQDPDIRLSPQRRDSILWTAGLMELWNMRHMHQFKEALPLAAKAYAISEHRWAYDRYSVTFEYALILLHNNKPAEAADRADELLRYKSDIRLDLQPFSRILFIMAQLALGNFTVIPSAIKGTRLWLKKKNSINSELQAVLKYAGLIAKAPANKRDAWLGLLKALENGQIPTINRQLQFDAWVKLIVARNK